MFGQHHNMKIHLLIFVFSHIINIKLTKFYIVHIVLFLLHNNYSLSLDSVMSSM